MRAFIENLQSCTYEGTVVAVTLDRMEFSEIQRFIHCGKPAEKLVRYHPGTTLSLASIRLPRTVSTFQFGDHKKK